MYTYTIIVDGRSYDLEPYTESLELRVQEDQRKIHSEIGIAEKRRVQKAFIKEVLKDDELVERITSGKEDPNFTNYVYCEIVNAYISPANSYETSKSMEKLKESGLSELTELLKVAGNAEKLMKVVRK
jgi:hypothetical protein